MDQFLKDRLEELWQQYVFERYEYEIHNSEDDVVKSFCKYVVEKLNG
jgi:hypothetical protein